MMISFTIWAVPIPKGRPRAFKRGRYIGIYTPTKTRQFEKLVRQEAMARRFDKPFDSAVAVELRFFLPIPISFSKKKRQEAIIGKLRPAKRPDLDNLIKSILDPLNGVLWNDDSQIVKISAVKYYADKPCIDIEISEISETI